MGIFSQLFKNVLHVFQVYTSLSQIPNMRVYAKDEIPERFHFKEGKFVAPLTLVAEPSWFITQVWRLSLYFLPNMVF